MLKVREIIGDTDQIRSVFDKYAAQDERIETDNYCAIAYWQCVCKDIIAVYLCKIGFVSELNTRLAPFLTIQPPLWYDHLTLNTITLRISIWTFYS